MTMSLMELKELLAMDSISKKGNIITVRKGFFYTRGRTVHDLIVDILLNFPAAQIVKSETRVKPFKGGGTISQNSHWRVSFILNTQL